MEKQMFTNQDHYVHIRKVLLSPKELELIHTIGAADVQAPVMPIETTRATHTDTFGNTRYYYPIDRAEEISMRLVFEHDWAEAEKYIMYPVGKAHIDPAKSKVTVTASTAAMKEFSKLLAMDYAVPKKDKHPTVAQFNSVMQDYSKQDYYVSAGIDVSKIDTLAPISYGELVKCAEQAKKYDSTQAQLQACTYDYGLEQTYGVTVSVFKDVDPIKWKIVVYGISHTKAYKSSFWVDPAVDSFHSISGKIVQMKKEILAELHSLGFNAVF